MIYDITLPLSEATLRYPGDPPVAITRVLDLHGGDPLTLSHVAISCHVGTHVDAPAHFVASGATVDRLPLESYLGPAVVVKLPDCDVIRPVDLEPLGIPAGHHVLLKTRNSTLLQADRFVESYCHLAPEAGAWLCARRPRSIGFDYYSLDAFSVDRFPAHTIVARANIPAFVCLALADVPAGRYTFAGLPLPLVGAEAAPVRAVLMDVES